MPPIPMQAQPDVGALTLQMDAHMVRLAYELGAARVTCTTCGVKMDPEVSIATLPKSGDRTALWSSARSVAGAGSVGGRSEPSPGEIRSYPHRKEPA